MTKGLARKGFDIDLKNGEIREHAFANIIRNTRIEHKSDEKCRKTGNLFIEYRDHGRPSGLATTTADYWAFEYDENCWLIILTERLKDICREFYRDSRNRVLGGDDDNYEGILIPISLLVKSKQSQQLYLWR